MIPLLTIDGLAVHFETNRSITRAIENISFTVNRGETVALVGESGSGKSVTALSILQLLPTPPAIYAAGKICFAESDSSPVDILQLSSQQLQSIRGNRIGFIFQEPMTSLNPVLTCGEQVVESLVQHKKITKAVAKTKTLEWFEKVKLPSPELIFDKYPHQLSGGQKQRVVIAIAICCEPALLICDEPTTALDVTVQKSILQLIQELKEQFNMGVLFITHDLGVVAEIADRAMVMYKGSIVEQGSTRQLFTQPQHVYTKALLACRPVNHERGKRLPVVADFLNPENNKPITPSTIGFESATKTTVAAATEKIIVIEVNNLSTWFPARKSFFGKTRGYVKAVDDVSFQIYEGETLGLVGESGCGKTTLGRTLLRLIEPTAGKIQYKQTDFNLKNQKELKALRKDLQIVFQDPYSSLNPRISIGSAIAEPMKVHGLLSNEKQRKEKTIALLEKVNLSAEHFNRYPHEFSGGQRQRIVIARALALNPSFIVCDESVSALDVSVQAQVLNLLNDLKKEYGFTIVFISHDLSVVRYISDRILVMHQGKIVESGLADDIYFHPTNAYTKKLIASIPKGIMV